MHDTETIKKISHIKWLTLPFIAVIFVVSVVIYESIPAHLKPINNINDCIDAGYRNKPLPTGGWQCTTPDGRIFAE